jgi:integrase/recombinase XerC
MFNQNYCASKPLILPEFLCEEEVDRLIDGVDNLRDKTILETMYSTGCRPKELRGMRISSIDFKSREIRVFGKNAHGAYIKERIILFTKRAGELMQTYILTRKPMAQYKDILFLNDKGKELTALEINNMVKDYVFKILHREIKRPNAAYILRHSFATAMMNRGVDLPYISEYLGHDNFSSVQVYTHTSIERLIKVYRKCHPSENPRYITPYCKEPVWPNNAVIPKDIVDWAKNILEANNGL